MKLLILSALGLCNCFAGIFINDGRPQFNNWYLVVIHIPLSISSFTT